MLQAGQPENPRTNTMIIFFSFFLVFIDHGQEQIKSKLLRTVHRQLEAEGGAIRALGI